MRKNTDSGLECVPVLGVLSSQHVEQKVVTRFRYSLLAKSNRIVAAKDFRQVIRQGTKKSATLMVVYLQIRVDKQIRFGVIVSKAVGNAVIRNRVNRKIRALCWQLLQTGFTGFDFVIRLLPASSFADSNELNQQMQGLIYSLIKPSFSKAGFVTTSVINGVSEVNQIQIEVNEVQK